MKFVKNKFGGRPAVGEGRGNIVVYMLVVLLVMVLGVVMSTVTAGAYRPRFPASKPNATKSTVPRRPASSQGLLRGRIRHVAEHDHLSAAHRNRRQLPVYGHRHRRRLGYPRPGHQRRHVHGRHHRHLRATRVTLSPKFLVPANTLGSGIQENGNLTIDGNVMAKGNINLGGSISINGIIIYGGQNNGKSNASFQWADPATIPSPPSVWYDATGTLTPPSNVINVSPMVQSGNGGKALGSSSPSTLDFRTASNGVLYYFGDVSLKNVTVYGSGTLVVFGNLTVQNGGFGDSLDPVNLVATGTISTQAGFRIYGSLYANGDITHQGQFDVTGTVNGGGSMYPTHGNGAGGATINRAPTPSFDPRTTVGSGALLSLPILMARHFKPCDGGTGVPASGGRPVANLFVSSDLCLSVRTFPPHLACAAFTASPQTASHWPRSRPQSPLLIASLVTKTSARTQHHRARP